MWNNSSFENTSGVVVTFATFNGYVVCGRHNNRRADNKVISSPGSWYLILTFTVLWTVDDWVDLQCSSYSSLYSSWSHNGHATSQCGIDSWSSNAAFTVTYSNRNVTVILGRFLHTYVHQLPNMADINCVAKDGRVLNSSTINTWTYRLQTWSRFSLQTLH